MSIETRLGIDTTMTVTHNIKDAIAYGNRLIMMHEGHIIFEARGEKRKS